MKPVRITLILTFLLGVSSPLVAQAGPYVILDINSAGGSNPDNLAPCKGLLFFSATDGENGTELWLTDGTTSETKLALDIYPGAESSEPEQLISLNDWLLFVANDGIHGKELWRTNGEIAEMVKDINPGSSDSNIGMNFSDRGMTRIFLYQSRAYFPADDGVHGIELWKSDGTEAGTRLVKDVSEAEFPSNIEMFNEFNGLLFFVYNYANVYRTDGTTSGTYEIRPSYITPREYTSLQNAGDIMYIAGLHGTLGGGLFKWTPDEEFLHIARLMESTRLTGSNLDNLFPVGDKLIFRKLVLVEDDCGDNQVEEREIWRSDGTWDGTVRHALDSSEIFGVFDEKLYWANGSRFLRMGQDGYAELISTNAPAGELLFTSNGLYYRSRRNQELGGELWRTDADAQNGRLLKDIYEGSEDSAPADFTQIENIILFTADDGIHGRELWQTDGTEMGTRLVMDINPGPADSNIQHMTVFKDMLIFSADDGVHGQELWAYKPNPSASLEGDMWLHYTDE